MEATEHPELALKAYETALNYYPQMRLNLFCIEGSVQTLPIHRTYSISSHSKQTLHACVLFTPPLFFTSLHHG
ncbi:hypothetical protein [Bartonella grahamii]|uniref:hypothetical protein n=1 Tax=Bartonella grahamii TaxID=33045 RepID=UPI002E7BEFDE|nr:hypothetical protein [Bartonella grahamii]